MTNGLSSYLTQTLDQVPQQLDQQWQSFKQLPINALQWVTDPRVAAKATWGRFTGGLAQYQQLLQASGDPTQPPQGPAQAQARQQLTQVMQGMVGPQTMGILAGPMAATADLGDLAKAHALLNEGQEPWRVWRDTGWAPGPLTPDTKPRFEVPDRPAVVNSQLLQDMAERGDINTVPLNHVLSHPELLRAYPQLAKVQVGVLPEGAGNYGQFDPRTSTLRLNPHPDYRGQVRPTMLHELQHAVQGIEGTSPGGSPSMFDPMHLTDLQRVMQLNDQLQMVDPASPEAAAMRAERDEIFADTSTPVDEHAARVAKLRSQHEQEAQTYVEHANRGHPEAQRYVDQAMQDYQSQVPTDRMVGLTPKQMQERATSLRLAKENPRFLKAYDAWRKAQARLSPLGQYQRLGGEAESRMVEKRSEASPEALRHMYPYHPTNFKSLSGVPLAELIHLPPTRNALSQYLP